MATVLAPFQAQEQAATERVNGTAPAAKPEVTTMTVTPDIAREWTARNDRNRPLRHNKIGQFARDMKAGNWSLNGETVKIDANGDLIDGQHRLYACIQADVPFETVVIRGLPPEAQDTVDTGVARRMADQLAIRGEPNANLLAAIARWSLKWHRGIRTQGATDQEPSHSEMLDFIDADPRLRDAAAWAEQARRRFRNVTGSVYGMAWLLLYGSDHAAADEFFARILTGENCPPGDPALAFRNRIWNAKDSGERLNQYEQLGYLIMAWNATRENRTLSRLAPPRGGFTPKTFPEPK